MKCIYMEKDGNTFLYRYGGSQGECDKLNQATHDYYPKDSSPKVLAGYHYFMADQPMFDDRDFLRGESNGKRKVLPCNRQQNFER